MIRLANPPSVLRYHCRELRDDGRRCKRCGNRSQLFGDRDVESGWEGYCGVCNMEWYTWRLDSSVRTCNRACFIHCLCGLIRLPQACCLIRDFIFQGYAAKLRWSILSQFRFKVLQVSWLACPMECWLEPYHRAISEDWVVRPSLRTLREVHVESPGFLLQCKATFAYFRLLDAVTTYLYHPMPCPPRCLPEDCPRYAQGDRDMSWRRCLHPDGWHWLWNEETEEHFFVNDPPVQWKRYMCASGVHTKRPFSWWYNSGTCRWFYEPSLKTTNA